MEQNDKKLDFSRRLIKGKIAEVEKSYGVIPVYKSNDSTLNFLLIRARGTSEWTFPKGHAELGETPVQAVLRELKEETGVIKVDLVPGLSFTNEYQYKDGENIKNKTVIFFVGFVHNISVIIQPEEIEDYKWVTYEDALKELSFDSQKNILKEAMKTLSEIDQHIRR